MEIAAQEPIKVKTDQYNFWQILSIWLAAGIPMWVLSWIAYPALSAGLDVAQAGQTRILLLTFGLVWQFVLSLLILYWEEGNIRLETIRRRFWLNHPRSPKTGATSKRLWWLIIPLILLVAAIEMLVSPKIDGLWTGVFPFLAEPPGFSPAGLFETPEGRAQVVGAWGLLALYIVNALFNTFLGEEFLFRGVLLPKMNGVFGKWDWIANSAVHAVYHLHQPWGIPGNFLTGLIFAFTGKRFHSNWFPIILHSGQSIYFTFLILGLVLGLA